MKQFKILIAPDKFKGSLSSERLCEILKKVLSSSIPNANIETCPLADGGDGSVAILNKHLNLTQKNSTTFDPLGREIEASYFHSESTAYIELASASGHVLLDKKDQNPMYTSTYGTGLQIIDAVKNGLENINLFLGGSSTNDGGIGIAAALGFTFADHLGQPLKPIGKSLSNISIIIPPDKSIIPKSITLFCDVTNPPFGPNGAAQIYAKQKGASSSEITQLDQGIEHLCRVLQKYTGQDLTNFAGGGAAGATALSLTSLLNAKVKKGSNFIAKTIGLEEKISKADYVISGEGNLDNQSLSGKAVSNVAKICKSKQIPLLIVAGNNQLVPTKIQELGIDRVYCVLDKAKDLEDAIRNVEIYTQEIGEEIAVYLCK